MIQIGPYNLTGRAVLAPMAGVTDLPFRRLCRHYGAALVVSEMVISNSELWDSRKTRLRLSHDGDEQPRSVQIAGSDPAMMADAARRNVELGADIIDINMGCPAKKVCRKAAGSALLRDPALVGDILRAVVAAVEVPVTLKIRTGWSPAQRNGVDIARLAEDSGIAALAVHGRTRECRYNGHAEYDTIAAIVDAVQLPVFANGDITSAQRARQVLDHTGAAGVMIGRGAQGRPWIFREINAFLERGEHAPVVSDSERAQTILSHLKALHRFYGEHQGLRIARKHFGWYLQNGNLQNDHLQNGNVQDGSAEPLAGQASAQRRDFNRLESAGEQIEFVLRHCTERPPNQKEDIAA